MKNELNGREEEYGGTYLNNIMSRLNIFKNNFCLFYVLITIHIYKLSLVHIYIKCTIPTDTHRRKTTSTDITNQSTPNHTYKYIHLYKYTKP